MSRLSNKRPRSPDNERGGKRHTTGNQEHVAASMHNLQINPIQMENVRLRVEITSLEESVKELRQKSNRLEIANRNLSYPSNDSQSRIIHSLREQLAAKQMPHGHASMWLEKVREENTSLKNELDFIKTYQLNMRPEELQNLLDIRQAVVELGLRGAVEAHINNMQMNPQT